LTSNQGLIKEVNELKIKAALTTDLGRKINWFTGVIVSSFILIGLTMAFKLIEPTNVSEFERQQLEINKQILSKLNESD
jgi:hypothetical protein